METLALYYQKMRQSSIWKDDMERKVGIFTIRNPRGVFSRNSSVFSVAVKRSSQQVRKEKPLLLK
jgi:hypothetical protein